MVHPGSSPSVQSADADGHKGNAEPSAAWRPISSAPTDGTRFIAVCGGEIWHAYGAVNPKSGKAYFVRRCHERWQSRSWTTVRDIEVHGELGDYKVILTEGPEEYRHDWVSWSNNYDFAPTHWMPLPEPPK